MIDCKCLRLVETQVYDLIEGGFEGIKFGCM